MGLQYIIPGVTFTKPGLPVLSPDPMITQGSLWLSDASLIGPWPDPTNGAVIPNLVKHVPGNVLVGQPGIDASLEITETWVQGTSGFVEKTAKGAYHVIVSRNNSAAGRGVGLVAPAAVMSYLIGHPDHEMFFGAWVRFTRGTVTGGNPTVWLCGASSSTGFFMLQTGFFPTAGDPRLIGRTPVTLSSTESMPISVGVTGASPGWASGRFEMIWGDRGGLNASKLAALPSFVVERIYVEDLTVSGRTHAEVHALHAAAHAREHGVGGRYAGDTYTNPSVLP